MSSNSQSKPELDSWRATSRQDSQSAILTYQQVRRLNELMERRVPIHGRGSFPTLQLTLSDLIRRVSSKLRSRQVQIHDIRLNGGAASYVLAPENAYYNDLDLLFITNLEDESKFDVIRDSVLEVLREFHAEACQGEPDAREHHHHDNHDQKEAGQRDKNQDESSSQQQSSNHLIGHGQLNECALKEAYVHKMVKVNEDDRWSLISLGFNQNQNQNQNNHNLNNNNNQLNYSRNTTKHQQQQKKANQKQARQFPNSIELKFVDRMRRKFEFSVDSFQIILDSLIEFYHFAPQAKDLATTSRRSSSASSGTGSTSRASSPPQTEAQFKLDCLLELKAAATKGNRAIASTGSESSSSGCSSSSSVVSSSASSLSDEDIELGELEEEEPLEEEDEEVEHEDDSCLQSSAVISENFYPTVVGRSEYGNFNEALSHLEKKLIATRNPEEIRGGGLLKYCNLLVKNYKPTNLYQIRKLERYMCSRFFIDFCDLNQQQAKLESYLANHFSDDPIFKFHYLTILYNVVQRSTVCLMNHELRVTLNMIRDLAYTLNDNQQQHQLQHQHHHQQQQQIQQQQQQHQELIRQNSVGSHVTKQPIALPILIRM